MDELLIYLEPDEEITAVIDRLRESDAGSIRLIVPKGALILQSLVSLKLLKRQADALDKQIALVTADTPSQRLAAQAGLSVYRKPKDSEPIYEASDSPKEGKSGGEGREESRVFQSKSLVSDEPEEIPQGLSVHRYDRTEVESVAEAPTEKIEEVEAVSTLPQQRSTTSILDTALGRTGRRRRWLRLLSIAGTMVAVILLGVLAFLEFVPRAAIVLTLATEPLEQTVTVKAAVDQTDVDSTNARIPAERREVKVTSEKSVPTTGKKEVGDKASATLTLYNYWDSNPQTIAAGTVFVASDGTTFVATSAATIPGAITTLSQGKIVTTPGTTTLIVQAEVAGTDGNDKSGRFIIPSLPTVRQDKIYGETQKPSSGGTSRVVKTVTRADLDAVKAAVNEALLTEGKTKLTEGADGRLLDGAVAVTINSEEPSAAIGDQTETLTYRLTGTVAGLLIRDTDLKTATVAILSRAIPANRQLALRDNDRLVATAENLMFSSGTVDIRVTVTTRTASKLDVEALADSLVGQAISEAEIQLQNTAGIVAATIENRPRWLKQLPKRSDQISIKTKFAETNDPSPNPSPSQS